MVKIIKTTTQPILPTKEQICFFNSEGYLLLPGALDKERLQRIKMAVIECQHKFDNLEQQEKRFINTRRSIKSIVTLHPEFLDLIELNTTFPFVVKFLQHYNIQLLVSQFIENKQNTHQRAVGWHIDGGMPQPLTDDGSRVMSYLKVGYALTDTDQDEMGGLEIVPQSHKKRFMYCESTKGEQHQGDFSDSIHLKMKAGDAVIFDQRLWHSGAKNKSLQSKLALYYGYGYAYLKAVDYVSMPSHILEKCTPIGQQLLGKRQTEFASFSYYHPSVEDVPLREWYLKHFGDSWIR